MTLAAPQIAYENTGVSLQGNALAISDGLVDMRLSLEVTGLDRSTGRLTPTFTLRTLAQVVRVRIGETAVLMGFLTEPEPLSLSDIAGGASSRNVARSSFIVLLNTRVAN